MRTKTSSAMSATGPSSTAKRAWTMTGTAMSTTSTAGISSILLLIRWDRTASRRSNTAHVAGTIAAENGNGIGVCGVAGGRGGHSGVRVISCQMFTENRNDNGDEIVALKYGADAGAVISQNSWGYTNVYEMPEITKDAIDYFIEYAGLDENGVQVGPMKGRHRDLRGRQRGARLPQLSRLLRAGAFRVGIGARLSQKSYYSNFSEWIDVAARAVPQVRGSLRRRIRRVQHPSGQRLRLHAGDVDGLSPRFGHRGAGRGEIRRSRVHARQAAFPSGKGACTRWTVTIPTTKGRLGSGLVDAYLAVSMDRGIDPDPVADLRHSDTAGEVELTWSVPADGDDGRADSFILMWRVGTLENPDPDDLPEGAESVVIPVRDKQAGDEITYVLTDIAEQTRYTVAIVAVDPWGNRSETTVISFGTPANTPPALILESTEEVRVGQTAPKRCGTMFGSRQPRFHLRVAGSFRRRCDPQGGRPPLSRHLQLQTHPGNYTAHVSVSDSFGASDTADFDFTLLPDQPPVATGGFRPVYLGSMQGDGGVHAVAGFLTTRCPGRLPMRSNTTRRCSISNRSLRATGSCRCVTAVRR